jgi:hypothetical protein
MKVTDKIYKEASQLPEELAREVLDFIGYIQAKHGLLTIHQIEQLKKAQEPAMYHVWDNTEDEVWNDL